MFGDKQFNTLGFPTPTDVPETDGCRQFTIPSSTAWFALVMGCLMLLTEEENWQQFDGGIDVETAALAAQAIIDSGYENECAGGEDLNTVPFWQSDDGSDAAVEDTEDTWYNEASYFVIGAFLATMVDPASAITFTTNIRRLRLAYLKNGFGGIVEVIVDDVSVALIDTYASGTPYGVFYWDFGDDDEHTLQLVNTGDANENAVVNPAYGEYTIGIVRWNIDQQSVDFANQQRYDDATDSVQSSVDYGTTWTDTPEVDPRRTSHFPPPDTTDPQCDGAARIVAYVAALIDAVEDGLAVSALIGTLIDIILGSFAIWGGFLALLLFLVEALATALITAGLEDLQSSFTSTFYDHLLCYLYCNMNSDGSISQVGVQNVLDLLMTNEDVTIQNVMGAIVVLLGEGGLSDLAATRDETGDCGDCDCSWDLDVDLTWAWSVGFHQSAPGSACALGTYAAQGHLGTYGGEVAWICDKTLGDNANRLGYVFPFGLPDDSTLEYIYLYFERSGGNTDGFVKNLTIDANRYCVSGAFHNAPVVFDVRAKSIVGGGHILYTGIGTSVGGDGTTFAVTRIRLVGTGTTPAIPHV